MQIFPTFERILPVVYLGNLISKNVKNTQKYIFAGRVDYTFRVDRVLKNSEIPGDAQKTVASAE
jgi:hypothetical protein